MSDSRDDIAGFYRLALELKLLPKEDAIRWADEVIAGSASPDAAIIDLALAAKQPIDGVIDALRPMTPTFTRQAFRMLGHLLHRKVTWGVLSEAEAANLLYCIHSQYAGGADALGQEIRCIDESFEPWSLGPEKAARHVRDFLQQFAGVPLPPACC